MPAPSICQATCGGIATQFAEQAHSNPEPDCLDQSQNVDALAPFGGALQTGAICSLFDGCMAIFSPGLQSPL